MLGLSGFPGKYPLGSRSVEIIAYAVGDCPGEAVLEGTATKQGGFAAVRKITHFDEDCRAASVCQDMVIEYEDFVCY